MSRAGFYYTYLAIIFIDFVFQIDENYCLQVFLKECQYIKKITLGTLYITDDL